MREDLVVYEGIADTDGLDSFGPNRLGMSHRMMDIRCRLNSHRRPIIYRAYLTPEDVQIINILFKTGSKFALIELKKRAKYLKAASRNAQAHWDSLPDFRNNEIRITFPEKEVNQMELELD